MEIYKFGRCVGMSTLRNSFVPLFGVHRFSHCLLKLLSPRLLRLLLAEGKREQKGFDACIEVVLIRN